MSLAADPRLGEVGSTTPAEDPSILWDGSQWLRFAGSDGGVTRESSPDGLAWSAPVQVLEGATEPSVVYGESLGWAMAVALPTDPPSVGRARSDDGLSWSLDPEPWYSCAGSCTHPTLQHIGQYWILNHSEHTADFDGMRVHHSEDGESWSSGITHDLPDGADDPDILYQENGWLLLSSTDGVLRLWEADQIEGDKVEVGTAEGEAAFYRDGTGARIKSASAVWMGAERVWTRALWDGEAAAPTADWSCEVAGPATEDGPNDDEGALLADGCEASWSLDGAEDAVLRVVASGEGQIVTADASLVVDGPTEAELPVDGTSLSLRTDGQVALLQVEVRWAGTGPDPKDSGEAPGEDCGCRTAGGGPGGALTAWIFARRRRGGRRISKTGA